MFKALYRYKIYNINFWIENAPPPSLWNFSENSSVLVALPVPNTSPVDDMQKNTITIIDSVIPF